MSGDVPASSAKPMRDLMPLTSAWIDQQRNVFGVQYVNDCMRRAMKGERNCFYAVEAGHFLGTPFDWDTKGMYVVSMSVLTGAKFIAAFRDPKDAVQMVVELPEGGHGTD